MHNYHIFDQTYRQKTELSGQKLDIWQPCTQLH